MDYIQVSIELILSLKFQKSMSDTEHKFLQRKTQQDATAYQNFIISYFK